MNSGIYIIRNNKIQMFYIGSAVDLNKRLKEHCSKNVWEKRKLKST